MRLRSLTSGFAVVAVVAAGGCAQIIGTDWTPRGAGGGGSGGGGSGGAAASSDASTSSVVASSTATSASSSTGGCSSPTTCPGSDTVCAFRTCVGGVCGSAVAPVHSPCSEAGGFVCNGAGTCVVCVSDPDCHGMMAHCVGGGCIACDDGVQNGDETDVDCGGACRKCSAGQHCQAKDDCAPHLDCENGTCNGG